MPSVTQYKEDSEVLLYNLGDVHLGDDACDIDTFLRVVERIRANPKARWVSTGDICNVALTTSKSSPYNSLNLEEELDFAVKTLKPIADKCYGIVSSNHHDRLQKQAGMSLDKVLCSYLSVPFLGALGSVVITCGRLSHWSVLHHTTGGGTTGGAKMNKQDRLMNLVPGADIYLAGHTHSHMVSTDCQFYLDRKRLTAKMLRQIKVTTGHYINYDSSYAASMMLTPKPKGSSVIRLPYSMSGNDDRKNYEEWLED